MCVNGGSNDGAVKVFRSMSSFPTFPFARKGRPGHTILLSLKGTACGSILLAAVLAFTSIALAASGRQPAPPGSFAGAPPQYTQFTVRELERGFLALAFGSDLRIGAKPRGVRRFDRAIRADVIAGGSVDRKAAMERVIGEYARKVPNLQLSLAGDHTGADIDVRLIDEKDFHAALRAAFGAKVSRTFIERTDPQCMTSVKSDSEGEIVHSVSFIIVDKGDDVFLDCAYHELLHAFGLSNHDQDNPWTTLNQDRIVGYLSVYDRALLTLLYDPHIRPGLTRRQVRHTLPRLIRELGLATKPRPQ